MLEYIFHITFGLFSYKNISHVGLIVSILYSTLFFLISNNFFFDKLLYSISL
jgi:hypothetical protein